MDEMAREGISLQTDRELTSAFSPKRPRMDFTMTNNHGGERRFHFPELWTFQKTCGSPSSKSTLLKNVVFSAESGDEKPHVQPQCTELIVPPFSEATASRSDNAPKGLSKVFFITAETHLPHLGEDEQSPLTETDKLSSPPRGDAGGALAESHTSKDTGADTSSQPDCKRLGKSLEGEPPGGCCLPAGNDKDGRQVQKSVSQVFSLSSSDEEVRCQPDCTYEDALHAAGVCNMRSQSAEVKAGNQKKNRLEFSENILFSKEDGNSHISPGDYAESKSFLSNPEVDPSGNLADGVTNEGKISEVEICETKNVAFSGGETKVHINENGLSKNLLPSVAECAEGSTVSRDVVLARNIHAETVSVEVDDLRGVKGEYAAGKMIAKAWSEAADHATETQMPARISEEPTEGDNDPAPFGVIDPAIWSETDREAEEKHRNTESTGAGERSPSVKVCEMETQEFSTHHQIGQFNHQNTRQQCKEKEDLCQPYTEPQPCLTPVNETHNMAGNESSCHWKSSPSRSQHVTTKPPTSGDGVHESHRCVRRQLKGQNQSDCFPVSPDHLKTQHVEYSNAGLSMTDTETDKLKEREGMISFKGEIKSDEYWNLERAVESGEELLRQNEKPNANKHHISTADCISDTEGGVSERDHRLTLDDEQTPEEKERKEVTIVGEENKADGQENAEMLVKTDTTEVSHAERISEWTEGNISTNGNVISQRGQRLSCFHNGAETLMFESKDDLLVVTVAPVNDAVVPCQHDLSHSQNANNPTALNCNDTFSSVPSVFTFHDRVPRGFDTFEKIQLPPDDDDDDDDDDAGPGNSPVLTSLPRQLLKTSERQLSHATSWVKSDGHKEMSGFECHSDNTVHELLSSDSTCAELLNFIPEADIIALGRPDQGPRCDSACEHIQEELNPPSASSTGSTASDGPSDVAASPEFEMKEQFDAVLKELHLFFDISVSDFESDSRASTTGECGDTAEVSESDVPNCKEHLSSPELGQHRDTSSDDADGDRGGDPVVRCATGSCDGEQEVPLSSHVCHETSAYAAETHREPRQLEQRRKMWSPSFMCPLLFEDLIHRPPERSRRLEPLRTCTRPIRVGLSKRAKTKRLHCPHPYK